ncbi:MAG TPA: hypothetical protein VEC09_04250 [Actinomycetota bacterium]|nr:hypothetical protein [Actinomycetota bacterium]
MEGGTAERSGFPQPIGVWFTHRGNRYLLGQLHDRRGDLRGFGVWDSDRPGPPIDRFPVTPDGRDSAAARFRELEADAAIRVNHEPPTCPRCGSAMRVIDARVRTTNTLTGFVFAGLLGAAAANMGPKRFACSACHVQV